MTFIMPTPNQDFPSGFRNTDDYRRFRERLIEVQYNESGLLNYLGITGISKPDPTDFPALFRKTNSGSPLETFVRLFMMNRPVELEKARAAFEPLSLQQVVDAKLIQVENNQVSCTKNILPLDNFYFISDAPPDPNTTLHKDWVMGIGSTTKTLLNLTPRIKASKTLDLGCGCGIHALFAASHSDTVWATDRNLRAIEYAEFNRILNDKNNIKCIGGNLFEPISNEKFDLIISNPPFVISPSATFTFRDSGLRGDKFCYQVIRESFQHLEIEGTLVMMFNWVHHSQQDWRTQLRQWFEDMNCNVFVMRHKEYGASDYASHWIGASEGRNPDAFEEEYNKWMRFFDKEGIEAISMGALILRKSLDSKGWFHLEDSLGMIHQPVGDDIQRLFKIRDFFFNVPHEALLRMKFNASNNLSNNQTFEVEDGLWATKSVELNKTTGIPYSFTVDAFIIGLISQCNGAVELGKILQDFSTKIGEDPSSFFPKVVPFIRHLIECGFLLPEPLGHM